MDSDLTTKLIRACFDSPEPVLCICSGGDSSSDDGVDCPDLAKLGFTPDEQKRLSQDGKAYRDCLYDHRHYPPDLFQEAIQRFPPLRQMPRHLVTPSGFRNVTFIELMYHSIWRGLLVKRRLVRHRWQEHGYASIEVHRHRPTRLVFPWQQAMSVCNYISHSPRDGSGYPFMTLGGVSYLGLAGTTVLKAQWVDRRCSANPPGAISYAKLYAPYDPVENPARYEIPVVMTEPELDAFQEFLASWR